MKLGLMSILFLTLFLSPVYAYHQIELNPIQDAYVWSYHPDTNYNVETLIVGGDASPIWITYMMFNLSSLPDTSHIEYTLLNISCNETNLIYDLNQEFWIVTEMWNETNITWNNKPFLSEKLVEEYRHWMAGAPCHSLTIPWLGDGRIYGEYELKSYCNDMLKKEKLINLAINGSSPEKLTTWVVFNSKESSDPPVLYLEYSVCGDGVCEGIENQENCCLDCGCPSGYTCVNNECKYILFLTLSILTGTGIVLWSVKSLFSSPRTAKDWIAFLTALAVAITLYGVLVSMI